MSTDQAAAESSNAGGVAPGQLAIRARIARQMLRRCRMCEHRCGINRLTGQSPVCRLGEHSHVFKMYVSYTEEHDIIPTLRVYLSGCNLRCRFCNVAHECFEDNTQRTTDLRCLAGALSRAVRSGVKSINLLGGEPSLHTHNILELAAASRSPLPLVLNTNGYMTPAVIDLLRGAISIHLVDFKFGNNVCANVVAGVPRYVEVVTRNLTILSHETLIVRHLLMPGHLDCCFRPVAAWLDRHLPGARFQLMTGYVPDSQAAGDPRMGRLNSSEAIREAVAYLRTLNLDWDTDAGM